MVCAIIVADSLLLLLPSPNTPSLNLSLFFNIFFFILIGMLFGLVLLVPYRIAAWPPRDVATNSASPPLLGNQRRA